MSIYGIKMAARTLGYLTRKSAILQNNLANQATDGFKFDYVFGTNDTGTSPTLNRAISFANGSLLDTGNPFDLALRGPGFFAVQTPQGERLTRNGYARSRASTGVLRLLVMWLWTALGPSAVGRAPMPPAIVS